MYTLCDVHFSYDKDPVLQGIDLAIPEGSFLGLLGPNGSGKTTLLKLLSGVLVPYRGEVLFCGRPPHTISPGERARQVAVVPQDIHLDFPFTVEEVVAMGRYPYLGWWGTLGNEDVARIQEALDQTGLLAMKDRLISQLSGGERQRAIMARALAQNPRVLLLDEPVSNLDIRYQQEIYEILSHLNRERGLTIIIVSHDLNLAAQYCEEVVLLSRGVLRGRGQPWEVLKADAVEEVYGVPVEIMENLRTRRPQINLIPRWAIPEEGTGERLHIIGGGGAARDLLYDLNRRGYALSLGVVNGGDTDAELARRLGLPRVLEAPFSPITRSKEKANEKMIQEASIIILADIPFGPGNISNLEQVVRAARSGQQVIRIQGRDIGEKDFTGGRAQELWQTLTNLGALDLEESQLGAYLTEQRRE